MNVNINQVNSNDSSRAREKEKVPERERERDRVERTIEPERAEKEKEDSCDEELKIIGKVCRVYHQGKQLFPVETLAQIASRKKRYVIIPIRSKNNCVEFIKVPMMKAERDVKATNVGNVNVCKIDPDGCERLQKVPLWVTDKNEILLLECRSSRRYSPPAKEKEGTPKRESVEYVYKRREEHAGTQTPEPGSTRKFRCRRKSKGTPPKDKKKNKMKGNKKAKD